MSITDELREYARIHQPYKSELYNAKCADEITAIADRIDAEHEQQMRERKGCIHYDQERHYCNVHDLTTEDYKRGYDDGFASADDWLGQHESDMAEHGWVRLPKDADGEYIHAGDEMCGYGWPNGGVYCRAIVNEATILVGPQDGAYRGWLMWAANECRHHHAPTVEDVLREFADEVYADADNEIRDRDFLCAKYAKRLTLAGDAE